jgi:hypothetical protein
VPAREGPRHCFIRVPAAITRRTHFGLGLLYDGRYEHIRDYALA